MNEVLDKALAEVAKLSDSEQEAIGAWLLEELSAEREWDKRFAESADLLARLADEALAEHREGRTQQLEPDAL